MNAYWDVDDVKGINLEHIFFKKLQEIPIKSFPVCPNLIGFSATVGEQYTMSKKQLLKNTFFAKCGFFDNYETTKQKIILHLYHFQRKIRRT